MKSWVKWYTETNHDPDIGSLTWAQRGIWAAMWALCGEVDARDEQDKETGELDTPARLAWHLRIDTQELRDALDAFAERGTVEERDGIVYLPNYPKQQERAPSDSKEAVAVRVKRHRAKDKAERNEDVTSAKRGETSTDTESDTESDKKREDTESDAQLDTAFGALVRKAEALTGNLIGGYLAKDVDALSEAGVTAEELQEAWDIASGKGWGYARTVALNKKKPRDGPPAGRRDSGASYRPNMDFVT